MRSPRSLDALENLGRVRLSSSFYMRDFLYSEISNFYGVPNVPADPDLAIEKNRDRPRLISPNMVLQPKPVSLSLNRLG